MPIVNPEDYQPRDGEAAMMTTAQREAACIAHYKELAAAGMGRFIVFGDGRAWFVPNDLGEIAKDIETVLTGKSGGLAGFVIGEALRLVVDHAREQMPAPAAPAEAAADTSALSTIAENIAGLSTLIAEQTRLTRQLGDRIDAQTVDQPVSVAPAAPVEGVAETILARLEDASFRNVNFNQPGVSRGTLAFVNLYNGARLQGKEPIIPLPTPAQAIEATMEGINRLAEEAGSKRLVWRTYPELRSQDGGYFIRCRLLAMEEK